MKQLRVLVLFQLLLLVLSCQKEGTKAESQIQPVYDVVREVNLSTLASKSGVEVIRFGKGVIVDFNQQPSDSVYGIHVYDEKGNKLLEKMDSSYYVKTDRKKSGFVLSNVTKNGRAPTEDFEGEWTHTIYDNTAQEKAKFSHVPSSIINLSKSGKYFTAKDYGYLALHSTTDKSVEVISKSLDLEGKLLTEFFGDEYLWIVSSKLERYLENEKENEIYSRIQFLQDSLKIEKERFYLEKETSSEKNIEELAKKISVLYKEIDVRKIKNRYPKQVISVSLDSIDSFKSKNLSGYKTGQIRSSSSEFLQADNENNYMIFSYRLDEFNYPFSKKLIYNKELETIAEYSELLVRNLEFIDSSRLLLLGIDRERKAIIKLINPFTKEIYWEVYSPEGSDFKLHGVTEDYVVLSWGYSKPYFFSLDTGNQVLIEDFKAYEELLTEYGSNIRITYNHNTSLLSFSKKNSKD
ncbi:MAG: hypothetical protein ABJK11_05490 [Balneola sp.]